MKNFLIDEFNISKVDLCIRVLKGTGQKVHKNRYSHGLVMELCGVKRYNFDDGTGMTVKKGDVFYLPKFSNYEVAAIEEGDCIAINFDLQEKDVTYPYFSKSPVNRDLYKKYFEKALSEWEAKKEGYKNACKMNLYGIIYHLQREKEREYLASKAKIMAETAVTYINERLSDYTLTVAEIAKKLSVSPEYFRAVFKNAYGVSPKKYIAEKRIEKAKELIKSGEFSMREVGEMCGYESFSYFSREFKRYTGVTATEYLK